MSVQDIFLRHVCPGVGAGIALLMYCSPMPAILRCNRSKTLGELNALPFVAMAVNCTAWIFYALLHTDFYIYFGNIPGLLLGMFYVMTCYKFSKEAAQDLLRNLMLGGASLFLLMGLVSMAANLSPAANKTLWGATCVAVLGVYYVAPLSSVAQVIAQRDSSSLHWPLCTMNIINGMLWFAYGLALKDWFVCLPNGIGAGFNVICLALCFVFPATRRKQQQQQQQPGHLERINPAANWGVLRLQSIARPPGDSSAPPVAAAGASGGGFFDLTQLRWRSGRANSLKASFVRLLSGRSSGGSMLPPQHSTGGASSAAAGGRDVEQAANGVGGVGVAGGKGVDVGYGGKGDAVQAADKGVKAAGEDVEQAYVVADSTAAGLKQQQQL